MKNVAVSGAFDDVKPDSIRFLQEAAKLGRVHALLWPDGLVEKASGAPAKFPEAERLYMAQAVRYVDRVIRPAVSFDPVSLPESVLSDCSMWIDRPSKWNTERENFCTENSLEYKVIPNDALSGFPDEGDPAKPTGKSVLVTGCYDWFHSGHIRFFEEVSELASLYVVVGNDENVKLLKGEGHPMFSDEERRYLCGSMRYVHQALISTGEGWMDAAPEIALIHPDMYAVNEDGDKEEKRRFCKQHGIEYVVLKRVPKEGLKRRSSTNLRGF
ncbi:MAG: adenylyltransferase/cytidyltransferase family protein [Spirochaetales bacterium]|jgi:cytidyltransferase-like protein|nr:adenylyltransferase/cytidyltransferase family protein [Spirochaetales bacterium]